MANRLFQSVIHHIGNINLISICIYFQGMAGAQNTWSQWGPLPLPWPFTAPLEGEPSPEKLACWPPSVMMASLMAPVSIGGTS